MNPGDLIRINKGKKLLSLTGVILEVKLTKEDDPWEDGFFVFWSDGNRCWSSTNFIFDCCERVN